MEEGLCKLGTYKMAQSATKGRADERRAAKWISLEKEFEESAREFEILKQYISLLPEGGQKLVWKHLERDYLTGAFNYGKLMRYGKDMEKILDNHDVSNLSLLMIDIDKFAKYNNDFGHERGNDVLRKVPKTISLELRKYDHLFRYGGEEFVVTLPGSTLNEGRNVAERIRRGIERESFYGRNVTVSIGVENQNKMPLDMGNLIMGADLKVYEAKANGRNQVR